jgi:5'-nucleotidase
MSDMIALFDMDGTLCDYDGAMQAALEALRSPYEPIGSYGHGDDSPSWLENRRRVVSTVPGFWRDLKPLPVGFMIVDVLTSLGFSLYVMTKGPQVQAIGVVREAGVVSCPCADRPGDCDRG